jgi:hypothetical protein
MISVKRMVYWMIAEFMQGAFDAGEACLLPILSLVEPIPTEWWPTL